MPILQKSYGLDNSMGDLLLTEQCEKIDPGFITFSKPFMPQGITINECGEDNFKKECQTSPKKNRSVKECRNELIQKLHTGSTNDPSHPAISATFQNYGLNNNMSNKQNNNSL